MAAPVVTARSSGQLNGIAPDNFALPSYSAGDLVMIFFSEGSGTLFIAKDEFVHGLWSMFRQARFSSVSLGVIFKFMDGTEGSTLDTIPVTDFGNAPPKSYRAITVSGADPYRGFDKQTNIGSNDFNDEWPTGTSVDPPSLTHPFPTDEELLWFALGAADAVAVGAESDITAGPSPVDFSDVDYYLPTGISPAQPRASYRMYAERTSDDAAWDPAAWAIVNTERRAAWTMALPPARQHRHPDLIKTEYAKTGSMATPQTVSVTVPAHSNGLMVFCVCAGHGCTLVLDPSGLAIVPSLGPSELDIGDPYNSQMFYCEAPPAGTYDLELTKLGTANHARVVITHTFDNVDEVVDWGSVNSNAASHTVSIATQEDHVAVALLSQNNGGAGQEGFTAPLFDAEIDGVPMAPKASAMTISADVPTGNQTIICRSFVGRTSGGTQNFVAHYLGRTSDPRRFLVMYLRGLDDMNAPWWGTEF